MKIIEFLTTIPIAVSVFAGANLVAGSEAAADIATTGVHGTGTVLPIFALIVLSLLLASGAYFVGREMREEANDRRERLMRQSGSSNEISAFGRMT